MPVQLAIVTICDHCTRVKVGGSKQAADSRILGLLFGVQDGLQASIMDAIELQVGLSVVPCPVPSLVRRDFQLLSAGVIRCMAV